MKKKSEILIIVVLFSALWVASFISYSGFYGADEGGYVYFSRNLDEGLKECFQNHRLLHLSLLSVFSWNLILAKFYGYIFSLLLIFGFYLVLRTIIIKISPYNIVLSLLFLITSPIFIVMSPTAYTEIPALSLMMLSLYAYLKRKFYFSGVFSSISIFFKEIGIFMACAILIDIILMKRDLKTFRKFIFGFLIIFIPLFFSYYIFTKKIWLLYFLIKGKSVYSKNFSLVYDHIFRKLIFLGLLGIGVLPLIKIGRIKLLFHKIINEKAVLFFYLIISIVGYSLFYTVSPRFSIFFLPVMILIPFLLKKRELKLLIPLLLIQSVFTIFMIQEYTEPYKIKKSAVEYILNNFSGEKIYGFDYIFHDVLKKNGFEIVKNEKLATIVFTNIESIDHSSFRIIKKYIIPCKLKIFRMLKCEERVYVIALKKSYI